MQEAVIKDVKFYTIFGKEHASGVIVSHPRLGIDFTGNNRVTTSEVLHKSVACFTTKNTHYTVQR